MSAQTDLIIAFVQGAQWWEWKKSGATMWTSDRGRPGMEDPAALRIGRERPWVEKTTPSNSSPPTLSEAGRILPV